MIDLSKIYDLDVYASMWAKYAKTFLMDDLKNKVWVETEKNERLYFRRRVDKYRFKLTIALGKRKVNLEDCKKLISFLIRIFGDIENFIKSDKKTIDEIVEYYFKDTATAFSKDAVLAIKEVMVEVYEDMSEKYAYDLFSTMNIRTCPYCNRQYTFTIKKDSKSEFVTRPEMDHFYDKSKFPLLALCFYNLVPSCHECNHGKGQESVSINPYFTGFTSKFVIASKADDEYNVKRILSAEQIGAIKEKDDFKIGFLNTSQEEQDNAMKLGLTKLYNEHRDYVMEIIEKAYTYNDCLNAGLIDGFQGLEHSPSSVFDFVWGKYLDDAEMTNRPLSKLTKDILEQLDIKR